MTATICLTSGKHRHPTWAATVGPALRAAKRSGRPMRIYHCPACGGFHMTKLAVWIDRRKAA
jgi:hypothetical protein